MWLGVRAGGLTGTGIAFFVHYLTMFGFILVLVRQLVGFRWSSANRRLLAVGIATTLATFVCSFLLPPLWFTVLAGTLTVFVGCWCARLLLQLLGESGLAAFKAKLQHFSPFSNR
jgi:PST family polysaccharide transporter